MTDVARAILEQALRLEPAERAEIIERLFRSFDPPPDPRVEAEWAAEVERRVKAFDAGLITADPADVIFKRLGIQ